MDAVFPHCTVELPEILSATGAEYAQAAFRLEHGAVSSAANEGAVAVHEAILVPVQRRAQVRATVEVGENAVAAAAVDDYAGSADDELPGLPGGNGIQAADLHHRTQVNA